MIVTWQKPVPHFVPGKGLLHHDHYQISYVTNDIDEAVRVLGARYRVPDFRVGDILLPSGTNFRIRSAWVGNMAYEIICASGPDSELYTEMLPTDRFALRHHHFGYLVRDDDSWQKLEEEIARDEWIVRQRSRESAYGRTLTIAAPELGHFLEFVMPGPALIDRLDNTPGL